MCYLAGDMYQQKFIKISHDVSVEVRPVYLEDESSPLEQKHVFTYFITIRNMGDYPVHLLKRHWKIRDSNGEDYEVDGEGVVGKQPVIQHGGEHNYNSFCVLKSYEGSMEGYYLMERSDAKVLKVIIPKFLLVSHLLN